MTKSKWKTNRNILRGEKRNLKHITWLHKCALPFYALLMCKVKNIDDTWDEELLTIIFNDTRSPKAQIG